MFPKGQDPNLQTGNHLKVPESATNDKEPSSYSKLVIDPENVSSFYAVNPAILNMPVLPLNSPGQAPEKNLKNWHLDKSWFQLCGEVTSPFPLNRTVIKHELEKTNHVRFEEKDNSKEMSQDHEVFNLFQLGQNNRKLRELVEAGSLSSNRHSTKRLPLPYNPNDKILSAYLDLSTKKQQIRHNLRGVLPRENQRRKSCSCKWCGGVSKMEKKLEKRMWLDLNGGFGQERKRSTSPNSSTIGGKRKMKKTPSYANPLRRNKIRGITTLSRDGVKRSPERMSTFSGMDSCSGDLSLGHDDGMSEAARISTQLTKKKSSFFMVGLERGISKTISKSPNRYMGEGLTIPVKHTSELNEMFNSPLRLRTPKENSSFSRKTVKKSVGSKEGISMYTFDIGEITNRSRTPMKDDHELSPNHYRPDSTITKDVPQKMILEFEDFEMKKPSKLRIPIHIKSPKAKEESKAKIIKPKTIKAKETEKTKKEVLPPVKEKKRQEDESAILKEGLKKLISERLATQPEKITSIYENSSDYLFFKSNRTGKQHIKPQNQSQGTVESITPIAGQMKKETTRREVSPYYLAGRSSVGLSNLLVSKKEFRIQQSRSNKILNKTEVLSEEERSVESKLNVKSIDDRGSNATTVASKSNSLMKTAQNTPKHFSMTSARFILDNIPSSPKSSEDMIMNFYRNKSRKKF